MDAGIPGDERIVLRPTELINLAQFGIILGNEHGQGVTPVADHFFWFGEVEVAPPSWVVVHTGPGVYRVTEDVRTHFPVHLYYWGKPFTCFQIAGLRPVLVRISAVEIGRNVVSTPERQITGQRN